MLQKKNSKEEKYLLCAHSTQTERNTKITIVRVLRVKEKKQAVKFKSCEIKR